MQANFHGRNWFRFNCLMAYYVVCITSSIRVSRGLPNETGNVSFICGNSTLTTTSGTLYSSNFPDFYHNLEDCVSVISVASAFLIEVSFEVFQTESISDLNLMNEMCISDFVEIVAGERSTRICGNWVGKERLLYFVFITSLLSIRFHSNEQNSKLGFVMKWSSISAHDTTTLEPCAKSLLETATVCYEIIPQPDDWLSGHETCMRRGGTLAKIEDHKIQRELEASLNNSNLSFHAVWIGAHDRLFEGDYMWTDRSAIQFNNWFPGWQQLEGNDTHTARQPSDDGFSDEDCVEIRTLFSYPGKGTGQTQSFFWNDRNCNEKNPFICQHDKIRYKRSTEKVPLQCDNLINLNDTRPSVIVTSPGYPSNYPALVTCHTIVTAPLGKQLQVDFQHFDLEDGKRCEYDNITVSDLITSNNGHNVTQCGDWNRKLKLLRWISETNKIVISFQADNSKQFSGFLANISVVDLGNICNNQNSSAVYGPGGCWVIVDGLRNFTETGEVCRLNGGVIVDSEPRNINFAADLLNVTNSCKTIWMKSETQTALVSITGSFDDGSMCNAVKVCDDQKHPGNILLEYSSVITQVPCSTLNYVICKIPRTVSEENCSIQNITTESGHIDTFNQDGRHYNNNQISTWNFLAPMGYRLIFELKSLDIEYQDKCLYDFIETFNMTADRRYCGQKVEEEILISISNSAVIKLTTDGDITGQGFNLSWYWIEDETAFQVQSLDDNVYNISTVNYPNAFPDVINNCSSLLVPDKQRSLVKILYLSLPGNNCKDSKLEISSDNDVVRVICGGAHVDILSYFSRYILTEGSTITFCLTAPKLQRGEGVLMQLRTVPGNTTKLRDVVTISPDQSIHVSSLMYPANFPSTTTHELRFRTSIGYMISVTLNFTSESSTTCSFDTIELKDLFLRNGPEHAELYTCSNMTDHVTSHVTQIEFKSILNIVQIIVTSGNHTHESSSIKFTGTVSTAEDPSYLNKTRQTVGTFDECNNATCQNGGNCTLTAGNRFMCTCPPQFTGLFCQASMCDTDVNPCDPKHSTCHLTKSGYRCECDRGHWGKRCSMDDNMCSYTKCSGNGNCVSTNQSHSGCQCFGSFTGPKCATSVSEPKEELTIGQKLLKEPIWIGMIVIVNLVLFFCISYVIRRKCGKRIAKLFPERTKTASSCSKENSKVDASTPTPDLTDTHPRNKFNPLTLGIPSPSTSHMWSNRRKFERDDRGSISGPSTPTITEDNQEAAMKLFAAYNTRKHDLSPNITSIQSARNNLTIKTRDIMSCGIQGGTVTLNPDVEVDNQTRDPMHGILRSYTISTEIRDFESRVSKAKQEAIRKTSSYAGSPTTLRTSGSMVNLSNSKPKNTHCFPEIRIINEHNLEEEMDNSDSDVKSDIDIVIPEEIPVVKNTEIANEVKGTDQHDSGYPSTTISTTQDGSHIEEKTVNYKTTAAERRKMFTTKAKSASFYKIGNENDPVLQESRKEKRDLANCDCSLKNSSSIEIRSFESDVCVSCKRDKIKRCAYSYDTDLDKIQHCSSRRCCATIHSSSYSHHKRHRRRRKCGHEHISSDGRKPHLHLRREQYSSSRMHHSRDNSISRRHGGGRLFTSSTESDSCLCSAQEMRYHRRHHIKEAFSEHDFRGRCDSGSLQDYEYIPRIDIRSDDTCKSRLMRSFLSDTYRRNFQSYSGPEITIDPQNKHFLNSGHDTSLSSPRDKSRSPSPGRNVSGNYHNTLQRKRSDTIVEVADSNYLNSDYRQVSPNSTEHENIQQNSPASLIEYSSARSQNTELDDTTFNTNEIDFTAHASSDLHSEFFQLPDVECVPIGNYENTKLSQSLGTQQPVISTEIKPLFVIPNDTTVLKDSAYQTKQSSIDKVKRDASLKDQSAKKTKRTTDAQDALARNDDRVQRHLHQAAIKLALLKRLQAKKSFSKDSAIHTFSEDDLSTDDSDNRGTFRPLVKRASGSLVYQMRDTILSKVQEEHSGVSRDTDTYNTPTDEPISRSFDISSTEMINSSIPMADMAIPSIDNTKPTLEETIV